jgi:phosphate ABC transporter phosphate-binding protein
MARVIYNGMLLVMFFRVFTEPTMKSARTSPLTKLAAVTLLLTTLGCNKSDSAKSAKGLAGSGSTFVYPMMTKWANEYAKKDDGCQISYRSLGSGEGIRQITNKVVDFACSDAPMTDKEIAKALESGGGQILHIPIVQGAVVPAYNLPDVNEPLKFTGPVLADIYLGKITKWNDPSLQKLNPGVMLPDLAIGVVRRADDSGTTYIWTDYLSKVSPEWQSKVGTGHDVKWPTGNRGVGNEGVANHIKDNAGALGYIELSYAHRKDIAFGLVQNQASEFIKGSLHSATTAANNAVDKIPDDLRFSITDSPGKGSYSISGTTWALIYVHQPASKGRDLVKFLEWVLSDGQDWCEELFYAKLPESLAARARQKLGEVKIAK